jgi:6,7-dimethyl-8-ribityllumazine synthase
MKVTNKMAEIECIQGRLEAKSRRFAVVCSRFNQRIVDLLTAGALDCLSRHGAAAEAVSVIRVPGAWELPAALEELAAAGTHDALIALAVVIRGETAHFDYICGECSRGIARVASRYRVPIGFGVLTCEDSAQAMERAGGKAGNKGWEAALAAIEMADLVVQLRAPGSEPEPGRDRPTSRGDDG